MTPPPKPHLSLLTPGATAQEVAALFRRLTGQRPPPEAVASLRDRLARKAP